MRRILAIFRKDARHLWPQGAVLVLLMGLAALFDPTYRGGASVYYDLLPSFALPLACWLIVISAIHQEKLPGDRQYWLTRPYSRKELVAAKILFVAVFVNLPLLVYHAGVYAALGIPLANHLEALFWRQVFFTAFYLLPAAALAVLTRTLGRVLVVALLSVVGVWAVSTAFLFFARRPLVPAQTPDVSSTILRAGLLFAGVSAIVALQYAKRMTAAAGALAAVTALAFFVSAAWRPAHGRQSSDVRTETAQLSLDSDPGRRSTLSPGGDPDISSFDIPVQLNGASAGVALGQRYLNLNVNAPGLRYTARYAKGELHRLAGGRAWLSFSTDRHFVEQTEGQPVVVAGSFDLQLFHSPSMLPLPKRSAVVVPGIGVCRDSSESDGSISFTCYSPSPRAALMAGTPGSRANWIVSPGSIEGSIPIDGPLQPVRKFVSLVSYRDWEEIGDLKLIAARPLPPVRVTFRLLPVRLREYLVTGRK